MPTYFILHIQRAEVCQQFPLIIDTATLGVPAIKSVVIQGQKYSDMYYFIIITCMYTCSAEKSETEHVHIVYTEIVILTV